VRGRPVARRMSEARARALAPQAHRGKPLSRCCSEAFAIAFV